MHAPAYSPQEIVDMARQLERCGESFYEAAARKVKNQRVRELFDHLRGEEVAHAATFERLLQRISTSGGDWRLDEEYQSYMRAVVEHRVFPSPVAAAQAVAALTGERDASEVALRFERDTIAFLNGLRRMVEPQDQALVDGLVKEEEEHIARLNGMVRQLAG